MPPITEFDGYLGGASRAKLRDHPDMKAWLERHGRAGLDRADLAAGVRRGRPVEPDESKVLAQEMASPQACRPRR